jgi:hypothetical protein
LERRRAEIIVCEQSPMLSDICAGLHLSPNALMALRVLGVEDAVIAIGSESDFLIIRSWKSGRIISRMRRGAFRQQFGAPSVTVHRADLLNVLRGALKTADIRQARMRRTTRNRSLGAARADAHGAQRRRRGGARRADVRVRGRGALNAEMEGRQRCLVNTGARRE